MDSLFRIGELAKRTGKTNRAIRFYEELEILSPAKRTESGYRLYGEDAVLRIEWIDKLHEIGYTLPDIQSFLSSLHSTKSGPKRMHELQLLYQQKLRETQASIERLQLLAKELKASISYASFCQHCEPSTEISQCRSCEKHEEKVSPLLVSVVTSSV